MHVILIRNFTIINKLCKGFSIYFYDLRTNIVKCVVLVSVQYCSVLSDDTSYVTF